MGTRGAYGFYSKGETKVTYNHFDGYPSALGYNILKYCNDHSIEEMRDLFDRLVMVDENVLPSEGQIEKYRKWLNNQVGNGQDWYSLLREAQGDLGVYDELKDEDEVHMIDSKDFLKDSLSCEWAYIINLDKEVLEIYEGFQKGSVKGRYGLRNLIKEYNSVSLIEEIPFDTDSDYMKKLEDEIESLT